MDIEDLDDGDDLEPQPEPLRLRDVIEREGQARRLSLGDLTVMSTQTDPHRLDTPGGRQNGAWLAEIFARLGLKVIHLRGLHYAIVVRGDIRKPDGTIYVNTEEDWDFLSEKAAKAARWLGYVPFDSMVDNRNEDPEIFVPESFPAMTGVYSDVHVLVPSLDEVLPKPGVSSVPRQPFRLVLVGEKSSLKPVLRPVAERFRAELVLPTGDISDTLVYGIAKRAAKDGRPLRVFYFADFDPSGYEMTICISRKLQALRDGFFPNLEIEVHRVALTYEQVARLRLPSTPLKEAERRSNAWRRKWGGLEQTEIDALATLQPTVLTRIAERAMEPFYDRTLAHRTRAAEIEWRAAADLAVAEQMGEGEAAQALADAEAIIDQINELAEELRERCDFDADDFDLPEFVRPESEFPPDLVRPVPLYDSAMPWADATIKLRADKTRAA